MRSRLALAAVIGLTAAGVTTAMTAGIPGVTAISGKRIERVKIVRNMEPHGTSSTSWVDIPGASTTISVPPRTRAIILVRFSGASECFNQNVEGAGCRVRVRVGQRVAPPFNGFTNDFDSTHFSTSATDFIEAHAIERSRPVRPGTYTVKMQWSVSAPSTSFTLYGWHLTVERIRR
jgi:hypothetical protein